jgi:hypothetical protein
MQIASLTDEQSQLLEYLGSQRFVSVLGCAGSGKTFLATLWAAHLAQEGFRVLFLCHNPYLAEKLQIELSSAQVDVFAFTVFIKNLLRSDRSPDVFVPRAPVGWEVPWTHYDSPSPNDLSRALDILQRGAERYGAVIVDEGQDYEAAWLEVAEACVSDQETSRFVIFFDDNPRLAVFGPQRRYADILAPIILNRSCRCAGEIDSLVMKLHPGDPQAGLLAREPGIIQEWNYTSESELFNGLRQALLAAEEFSPNLEDVVVISAESALSRLSKFAGLVIDTPSLSAMPSPGRLNWQAAVLRYLQGFGLLESSLSQSPFPTADDVKRVNKFCTAYTTAHRAALSRQPSYLSRQQLSWVMDVYGDLRLRWVGAQDLEYNPIDLLKFFSSPGWAASLPAANKRYRLSLVEELSHIKDYYPVRLVDIPSFKGLEAGAVIFILYNYFAENEDQFLASLYLAFSRARRRLYLVTPSGDIVEDSHLTGH